MTIQDNYFSHDADIGIIAYGSSLEECFVDGAKAVFALMTDLAQVRQQETATIAFEEADTELAFVTWLNLLIAKAQADDVVFSSFAIRKNGDHWEDVARGEKWRKDLERRIEVKGATLTMLSVKKTDDTWQGQCVVDV